MDCHHLLFQSLCVFLIASSAYGGPLPRNIASRYSNCYELRKFSGHDTSTSSSSSSASSSSSSQSSSRTRIDNLCFDSKKSTYYFLSSAHGTTTFIKAPISNMTVISMIRDALGIIVSVPSQPAERVVCYFRDQAHGLVVYNSIYRNRNLTRENFKIGLIHEVLLDSDSDHQVISREPLSERAVVYSELHSNEQKIITFKKENENGDVGDAVLIIVAFRYNISDVLINNNVVLRFKGGTLIYNVLTFYDEAAAKHFCKSLRDHFNPNARISVNVPPTLVKILKTISV